MVAVALVLREGDRARLELLIRSSSVRAGTARRARIVLLAGDGVANAEIARRVGVARQTVIDWRERYRVSGIAGLDDQPRSGRPRVIDDAQVVVETLTPPPEHLGVDALVGPVAGRPSRDFLRVGGADLAGVESADVAAGDVQVLHRP